MNIIKITVSIIICQLAGGIGALFTFSAIPSWYATLNKPSFSPPNFLFGPVWTLLYTLMGISAYLIFQKGFEKKRVKTALLVFAIHLVLNSLWSILFFGLKNPALAFGEIIILWLFIITLIILFYPINKIASYLLIPYLLWVSFASILNFSIWQLNKNPKPSWVDGTPIIESMQKDQTYCEQNGGKWLSEFKECESLSMKNCNQYGTEYISCASPCRHDPKAEVCIQSCVEVCKF